MAAQWDALEACVQAALGGPHCALKIVVFDEADYDYARTAATRHPELPIYLQVGNPAPLTASARPIGDPSTVDNLMRRFRWLVAKVVADHWFDATVLPQLHVLAWGNQRGV
jgi:7-carboxy-7-deazaguanine synthase